MNGKSQMKVKFDWPKLLIANILKWQKRTFQVERAFYERRAKGRNGNGFVRYTH